MCNKFRLSNIGTMNICIHIVFFVFIKYLVLMRIKYVVSILLITEYFQKISLYHFRAMIGLNISNAT